MFKVNSKDTRMPAGLLLQLKQDSSLVFFGDDVCGIVPKLYRKIKLNFID